jgi:hypothetical protein
MAVTIISAIFLPGAQSGLLTLGRSKSPSYEQEEIQKREFWICVNGLTA